MSVLTLDVTGTPLTVRVAQAGHAQPRTVGARVYAFAGNERSWIRAEPMVVECVLVNAPPATVAAYRALFADGAQVACSGDVFNNAGATITCSAVLTDEMEVGGTYWITTLTLTEVDAPTTTRTSVAVSPGGVGDAVLALRAKRRLTTSAAGTGLATVTITGYRRGTVSVAGLGTTVVTLRIKGRITLSAVTGQATTVAGLHAKRKISTSAAGSATTTASLGRLKGMTKGPATGRATTVVTLTKLP